MNDEAPRPYTEDELREMLLDHVRNVVIYWTNVSERDPTRGPISIRRRCEGVAFSILSMLDGCATDIPGFDLVAQPHEDDKDYYRGMGENWVEPGTTISTALHEFLWKDKT